MTEETSPSAQTDQTVPVEEEASDEEPQTKPKRSFAQRAQLDLNRARKALGKDWTKTDERFDFYLAEANVLAMLELADAFRASKNG